MGEISPRRPRFGFGVTWNLALLSLLLLFAAPDGVSAKDGAKSKKRRRKAAPAKGEMKQPEYFEEIEADNFVRKVFRKDKDALVLFYTTKSDSCIQLQDRHEHAAKFIQEKSKNVLCYRIDIERFGADLHTGKHKDVITRFKGIQIVPKMFLVRASEKQPLEIADKDVASDMFIVRFVVEHSSYRREFGWDEFNEQQDKVDMRKEETSNTILRFDKDKSVGRSKLYKEISDFNFHEEVLRNDSDVVLVFYGDQHVKSQRWWPHYEKAARMLTKKNLTDNIVFLRCDEDRMKIRSGRNAALDKNSKFHRYDMSVAYFFTEEALPRLYVVRNAKKTAHFLAGESVDWYRERAVIEFILNKTRDEFYSTRKKETVKKGKKSKSSSLSDQEAEEADDTELVIESGDEERKKKRRKAKPPVSEKQPEKHEDMEFVIGDEDEDQPDRTDL